MVSSHIIATINFGSSPYRVGDFFAILRRCVFRWEPFVAVSNDCLLTWRRPTDRKPLARYSATGGALALRLAAPRPTGCHPFACVRSILLDFRQHTAEYFKPEILLVT